MNIEGNHNPNLLDLKHYQEDVVSQSEFLKEEINVKTDKSPQLESLIDRYKNCFVEFNGLGVVKGVYHEIRTVSDETIRSKPYRLTIDEEESL
ncbi:hypothetical protein BD560DRAFT_387352, partial [Blakeslea trispora]